MTPQLPHPADSGKPAPGEATSGAPKRAKPSSVALAITALVVGAALSAGSAAVSWVSATFADELQGKLDVTSKGPTALLPLSLAALASLGAVLASRGWLRRVIGGVIVVAGLILLWLGGRGLIDPASALRTDFARPVEAVGSPVSFILGPMMAVIGGLLVAVAGLLVVTGPAKKSAIGSRYERRSGTAKDVTMDQDLDGVAIWKALDAHQDPTADVAGLPQGDGDIPSGGR
ncbi:Trp biosynthesis-associated membrane protein [Nakamurella antarctica]|nr:Trp biosynthesis-associated membrane protein [Nakamurella antarctica]